MDSNKPDNAENVTDSIADYHNEIRQIELDGYESGIKKARNALYITAVLIFIGEMVAMFTAPGGADFNIYIFIVAVLEGGIFVALALWTKKKPYTAIVSGLIAFIGILLLSTILNTYTNGGIGFLKSIFSGIIFKVIILANLIRALSTAKVLQNAKKETI